MRTIAIMFMLAILSITGCGRDISRPADLPPLFPCEIKITQEGTPLAGATVSLEPIDGITDTNYFASAITDERGRAIMVTYGFNGVPVGRYKVTVRKTIVEDGAKIIDSYGDTVTAPGAEYRTIERQYSNANATPHEIEITNKKTPTVSFDVGKPIKEKK